MNPGSAPAEIEPGIVVMADESHIDRLLTNLFRNTVEHAGDSVQMRLGRLDEGDRFFVADNGPGIPPAQRDAVFNWQHSTKEGGTGIGLKSVQQIIDAEGWDISITEANTGGARFEISSVKVED